MLEKKDSFYPSLDAGTVSVTKWISKRCLLNTHRKEGKQKEKVGRKERKKEKGKGRKNGKKEKSKQMS